MNGTDKKNRKGTSDKKKLKKKKRKEEWRKGWAWTVAEAKKKKKTEAKKYKTWKFVCSKLHFIFSFQISFLTWCLFKTQYTIF